MHMIVQCPYCGYRWWLEANAADRRLRCPKCFALLKVPHLSEVSKAAGIINQAPGELYVDDAGNLFG
jgi:ssDNA-binding Zn-finger/Zn-ribbon topoisomerase 1